MGCGTASRERQSNPSEIPRDLKNNACGPRLALRTAVNSTFRSLLGGIIGCRQERVDTIQIINLRISLCHSVLVKYHLARVLPTTLRLFLFARKLFIKVVLLVMFGKRLGGDSILDERINGMFANTLCLLGGWERRSWIKRPRR